MERISIIKNFLDLVGLTKKERILLLNALMQEWNLKAEDLSIPFDRSTSAAPLNDIDENPSISAPKQTTKTPVIVFTEEDAHPTDQQIVSSEEQAEIDAVEQTPVPTEAEATPKKRRGRRKKAEIDAVEQTPVPTEAEVAPKKRRGRRKKAEIDAIEQTPAPTEAEATPKKRRGRRKKAEIDAVEQTPAPTEAEVAPKKRRGRRKKAEIDAVEQTPTLNEAEVAPKKRRGRRKKAEIDAVEQTPAPTEAEATPKKRRGRRKKAEIDAVEQTPAPTEAEATPKKRRGRRKKAEIDAVEQTPTLNEAEVAPKKRRGRRKKAEIDAVEQTPAPTEVETTVDEQTPAPTEAETTVDEQTPAPTEAETTVDEQTPPPNEAETHQPKRCESPKKNRTKPTKFKETSLFPEDDPEEDASSAIDDDMIFEKLSTEDENFIDEVAAIEDLRNVFEEKPKTRSKKTKRRNPAFCYLADYPALMEQKIGYQQPFEFLYLWNGRNLLSDYVLPDMMPVGIYIPYQKQIFGKYYGFIISIYDEQVLENLTEALDYIQTKMQAIDGEDWSVMNSIQFGRIKTVSEALNHMLTKVGGDRLRTTYKTLSPKSNLVNGIGKFRYTIDVK